MSSGMPGIPTILTLIIFGLANVATVANNIDPIFGQLEQRSFTTQMSGTEEVPPVETIASGIAQFILGSTNITYQVNVTDIFGVTAAHIHAGNVGENGPVLVTLFESDTPINQQAGILAQGNISATDLEGSMQGKQISDLLMAMGDGETYINVHTQGNPNGEIRGQL